jgi:hypothetical protein
LQCKRNLTERYPIHKAQQQIFHAEDELYTSHKQYISSKKDILHQYITKSELNIPKQKDSIQNCTSVNNL